MSFSAKIILDSVNPHNGIRLVTSELTYPRFIHAEFMTHRQFSRNAASSRAIPTRKMIKMVLENPAMPVSWGINKKGMSADYDLEDSRSAELLWKLASEDAAKYAEDLRRMKLHKQITNRILEPWKWMTVICSATLHSNCVALRDLKDAQPDIQEVDKLWRKSLDESIPVERSWHIPYLQEDELDLDIDLQKKISVARCARVSYLTHDGKRDIEKDLQLYERLLTGGSHGHWSPFEHVAQATKMQDATYNFVTKEWERGPIWSGNFRGWVQYRKLHLGECQ